ncbi:glutamate receptor ionotropic, delta-1 [Trichonephila clavata]|uniref:Glutamate receptor ionotropic, delta-1 n=1 Tax=Trichonephila clavata TaxID=2740835 RepID=A0A8X6HZP2_TRICU|nr:glutamate receptor ionotropic, delta-1 [Trichonephila clavata]
MKFPKTITVACFHLNQLFEIPDDNDENAKPGGIDGLLLDTLAQALKFEYKLVRAPENYWGKRIARNNWTGMIGVISRDEADMGLGITSITEQRKEAVDFSTPYTENIFTFATHLPKKLPHSAVYFSPFDVYIWVGILITLFAVSFIIFIQKNNIPSSYVKIVLKLFGGVLRQPITNLAWNEKCLEICWYLFCIILSLGYTAVLYSFLSVPLYEEPVSDFAKLSEAVSRGEYRCLSPKGAYFVSTLLESSIPHLVHLGEEVEKNIWYVEIKDYLKESNFDEPTAIFGVKLILQFKFGKAPLTTKFISNDQANSINVGVVINKKFCCKGAINSAIDKINGAGLYKKIVDDEMYKAALKAVTTEPMEEIMHSLSVNNISHALIVLLIGYALSIMTFFVEILLSNFKNLNVKIPMHQKGKKHIIYKQYFKK